MKFTDRIIRDEYELVFVYRAVKFDKGIGYVAPFCRASAFLQDLVCGTDAKRIPLHITNLEVCSDLDLSG